MQNLNKIFGKPELDASGDIQNNSHGEGPNEVHFWLCQSAYHVAKFIFFFIARIFFFLLLGGGYKTLMSIL